MRKISKILILGLFFGAGLPLNFSLKIKCLPISRHYFSHKELISNIQMAKVKQIHQQDLASGYAGAFLPDLLAEKYKYAPKELAWQWFFPARTLTFVSETHEYWRYHLHERHLQRAIKKAVQKAQISKRASSHTFRHSFASHLLQVAG